MLLHSLIDDKYRYINYVIQIICIGSIRMFSNLLQDSNKSLAVTKNLYKSKIISVDFNLHKSKSQFREKETNNFHSEKQYSNEIKASGLESKQEQQAQVLIAEAESELLVLFREYLSSLGLHADTADRGNEALDRFLDRNNKEKPYRAIILDTHLSNPSGIDVAKRIHSEKPDQKIVLVTTTPKENLPNDCLKSAGLKGKDILIMPFKLSKLVSVLKN